MRKPLVIAAVLTATALLGIASAASGSVTGSTTVKTASVKHLGTVLVNSKGFVLYVFAPDKHKKVTCKKSCAVAWPPLKVSGKETAGGSAKASLLGADPNPGGGKVVTYAGWPLYTYVADTKPGKATGQDIDVNGGYWYVISPTGKVIKTKP
jgi:predicted lipoprotein with Yx(FWY)xxD motif